MKKKTKAGKVSAALRRIASDELEHLEYRGAWHEHHRRNHDTIKQAAEQLDRADDEIRLLTEERNVAKTKVKDTQAALARAEKERDKEKGKAQDIADELACHVAHMDAAARKAARERYAEKKAADDKAKAEREAKKTEQTTDEQGATP